MSEMRTIRPCGLGPLHFDIDREVSGDTSPFQVSVHALSGRRYEKNLAAPWMEILTCCQTQHAANRTVVTKMVLPSRK